MPLCGCVTIFKKKIGEKLMAGFYKRVPHWGFFFLVIFALVLGGVAYAEGTVTEERDQLKGIQKELTKQKQILKEAKRKEKEALSRLAEVRNNLAKTNQALTRAQRNIWSNESKIKTLSLELGATQKKLKTRGAKLKERIAEVYKSGGERYLDLFFGAKSMSDFVDRAYFFGKVLERDVKLIGAIEREYRSAQHKKTELKQANGQIKKQTKVIEKKKISIAANEAEKQKLYDGLKKRRAAYERKIAELEKSSKELEGLIQRKLTERAKAGLKSPKSSGKFMWPVRGRQTSQFGYRRHPLWGGSNFHTGLDIANSYGTSIRASDSGEVIFSGWWDGYGKAIVIDHGKTFSTVYGHLSRIYVRSGTVVNKGQVIGLLGSSGYSTGPHLHFEIRKNGKPMNPKKWLP